MRWILVLLAMISIVLLTGCSKKELNYTVTEVDGIKTYHNKNIPSDPNFKISPREVFTIHGFDENTQDTLRNFTFLRSTVVDSKGNIYLLDQKKSEIKKFDRNGIFIKSFCKLGSGPGELQGGGCLLCLDDTLYVKDDTTLQFSKFSTDGNFIDRFYIEGFNYPQFLTPVGKTKFINDLQEWEEKEDGSVYVSYDLQIRYSQFKLLKSLRKDKQKYIDESTNHLDTVHPFCIGKHAIYIAKISTDEFRVDVYDFEGKQLYSIRKDFRKISITEEELKEFGISQNTTLGDKSKRDYKINYKKAVNAMGMFEDKNGNLLVQIPQDRNENNKYDFIVDAFKDGVFINSFKMDIGRGFDFYNSSHQRFFIGDRIYYQNREDNNVKVFEY
ncbi:TPA: hypothetical protein DCR49_05405 [Candidatus Delongbacteria bacterium]|nr:hypothetical protein [Candidatus Delongbacteria bacterium]